MDPLGYTAYRPETHLQSLIVLLKGFRLQDVAHACKHIAGCNSLSFVNQGCSKYIVNTWACKCELRHAQPCRHNLIITKPHDPASIFESNMHKHPACPLVRRQAPCIEKTNVTRTRKISIVLEHEVESEAECCRLRDPP